MKHSTPERIAAHFDETASAAAGAPLRQHTTASRTRSTPGWRYAPIATGRPRPGEIFGHIVEDFWGNATLTQLPGQPYSFNG